MEVVVRLRVADLPHPGVGWIPLTHSSGESGAAPQFLTRTDAAEYSKRGFRECLARVWTVAPVQLSALGSDSERMAQPRSVGDQTVLWLRRIRFDENTNAIQKHRQPPTPELQQCRLPVTSSPLTAGAAIAAVPVRRENRCPRPRKESTAEESQVLPVPRQRSEMSPVQPAHEAQPWILLSMRHCQDGSSADPAQLQASPLMLQLSL